LIFGKNTSSKWIKRELDLLADKIGAGDYVFMALDKDSSEGEVMYLFDSIERRAIFLGMIEILKTNVIMDQD
jgi:hypothetical protein